MTRRRKLGVIGTFVWDVIHGRDPARAPVEEWGGIAYSLGALDAALDDDWEIVPLIKVGNDLIAQAREFARELRHMSPAASLIEVPYPNNRVALHYFSDERRSEILSGGIPGWSWIGLKPLLPDLDALYVNMISGVELDLETAQLMRQHFKGPVYCDLHSLLLSVTPDGTRTPRELPNAAEWFRCFDLVQVNEDEMNLMASDPLELASVAMASGVQCLVVTMGARGAVYFAAADFSHLSSNQHRFGLGAPTAPIRTSLVPAVAPRDRTPGDPTGCGDVWGATYFSRLLSGDNFAVAFNAAIAASSRNVEYRGATGLASYLRGGLATK